MESKHLLERIEFMQDQYKLLEDQLNYGSAFYDESVKTCIAQLRGNYDAIIEGFKDQLKEKLLEESLKTLGND